MAPSATLAEQLPAPTPLKSALKENGNGFSPQTAADAMAKLDPNYAITEQPIGTRRPIRVACMGAGYSGLMMGIVFSQQMQDKNAELVIYERNEDLGGTWLENR